MVDPERKKVVVVHPSPDMRDAIANILGRLGYNYDLKRSPLINSMNDTDIVLADVSSASSAVTYFRDVALVIARADEHGLETLRNIRANRGENLTSDQQAIPFIVIPVSERPDIKAAMKEVGGGPLIFLVERIGDRTLGTAINSVVCSP